MWKYRRVYCDRCDSNYYMPPSHIDDYDTAKEYAVRYGHFALWRAREILCYSCVHHGAPAPAALPTPMPLAPLPSGERRIVPISKMR